MAKGDDVVVNGGLNDEKEVEIDEIVGIETKHVAAGSVLQHFPAPSLVEYLTDVTEEQENVGATITGFVMLLRSNCLRLLLNMYLRVLTTELGKMVEDLQLVMLKEKQLESKKHLNYYDGSGDDFDAHLIALMEFVSVHLNSQIMAGCFSGKLLHVPLLQ